MAAEVVYSRMSDTTASSNSAGLKSLITLAVLILSWVAGFMSRLFSVIRFESVIHEFDPWFNYRSTKYMTENGFYNFLNWFDDRAWYPLGRIVGGTVYPGLMITSGAIHWVLDGLNMPVHIREICVFLAPLFSGLTAISAYLLTKELWTPGAGYVYFYIYFFVIDNFLIIYFRLFAAAFICIVPGYISRSVAGSYDNEGIAIFALLFTFYLWIKAVKTGSVMWATLCAVSYLYMAAAWGGYVFIINLIPLHVFVLLLLGRFSTRVYVAYSTFYVLAVLFAMQVPFIGFQPIRTSEHMAAAGVFALINAYAVLQFVRKAIGKHEVQLSGVFSVAAFGVASAILGGVVLLTYLGYIAPWTGRFYSLWDTGYAKIHIPIIASVSEHQPTTWVSFFFDLHVLVCTFAAGAYFCVKQLNDERVFIVLYAVFASYFAGVMVRLMLTLTPVVCILSAIAFSNVFDTYLRDYPGPPELNEMNTERREKSGASARYYDTSKPKKPQQVVEQDRSESSEDDLGVNSKFIVVILLNITLLLFALHCTWVTSSAYSSPSIVLASYNQDGSRYILDDFREAYFWLWQNTKEDARIMSWWDYGYQIAGMGNRTTLVDNNTWNNSHIALVGKAMASNESASYKIMRELDVDYVLVIFGGLIGYSGDDINKFLWMVRIAEGEHPQDIRESDYFTPQGDYRIDSTASKTMLNSLMYKLSYWKFGDMKVDYRQPSGYDRTRGSEIGLKHFNLEHVEEAYTSEHWLVRIYRVKPLANRKKLKGKQAKKPVRKSALRKTKAGGAGVLGAKQIIAKGKKQRRLK